jgi:hypothetical protein
MHVTAKLTTFPGLSLKEYTYVCTVHSYDPPFWRGRIGRTEGRKDISRLYTYMDAVACVGENSPSVEFL